MTSISLNDLAASNDPNEFNDVSEDLQVHSLALKLLATAFYLPPAEPFLTTLCAEELLAYWPLAPDDPDAAYGLQLLRALLGNSQVAALLPALREDHTALFIGLAQVGAPPWESVYLSRDHLIFDQQTLEVREFYARFSLQIPRIGQEPDDHIVYELLFLAHLMEQAARALAAGDAEAAARLVGAARTFFVQHPQQWVALFIERLAQHARTDYYRGLAYLLKGSVKVLPMLFDDYLASIEEARL